LHSFDHVHSRRAGNKSSSQGSKGPKKLVRIAIFTA
jgi:hypothetical protein